jgi:hypothetical protein
MPLFLGGVGCVMSAATRKDSSKCSIYPEVYWPKEDMFRAKTYKDVHAIMLSQHPIFYVEEVSAEVFESLDDGQLEGKLFPEEQCNYTGDQLNLASHGYVVAKFEKKDPINKEDEPTFTLYFVLR